MAPSGLGPGSAGTARYNTRRHTNPPSQWNGKSSLVVPDREQGLRVSNSMHGRGSLPHFERARNLQRASFGFGFLRTRADEGCNGSTAMEYVHTLRLWDASTSQIFVMETQVIYLINYLSLGSQVRQFFFRDGVPARTWVSGVTDTDTE